MNIYEKLNKMKEEISTIDFVMDRALPSNMGGGEYARIGQLYGALHKECIKYNTGLRENAKFHRKRDYFFDRYTKKKSISKK